ncbi:PP2C family protein-serine/threonine phosphatase [Actinomadura flavalba]|uniref:PP2C family protein-serine/threonine phosphatase n=1 Tax=Actinomadura flavalba TaxID=1120938 RepID=UPI00037AAF50|nr:PP2C family protein-serine/threonine phosphatase [Actinomadura flavalba]
MEPPGLLSRAAALIFEHTGVPAEVYLIDYRHTHLVPVEPDLPLIPVDNTPEGHAFAAQQIVTTDDGALVLPLTVYGDRSGILILRTTEPQDEDAREAYAGLAGVLARALRLADAHTDLPRRLRRRARLTLAAEMQWELLPGSACSTDEFRLAGQLEPAYAVWGDNFDWSITSKRLTLTVSNGTGTGTDAAALTHLAISALRNARRSGGDIVEQAALADQTLYAAHRGSQHLATLLLDFELGTGRVRAIDAGSPRVYRLRGGVIDSVDFEAQLPLGMFGDTHYSVQEFTVRYGDRLIVVSDGVHTAESRAGELYGKSALVQAIRDTRLQPPSEAVRGFIRRFLEYHDGAEPRDDAVVVCLDWRGGAPTE